jgi:hypothetical protein
MGGSATTRIHYIQQKLATYEFIAELVSREVDGAKGAAADLVLDEVLVDTVVRAAVVDVVCIFESCVEGFLQLSARIPSLGRRGQRDAWRTLTLRWADGVRLWCLIGLWRGSAELGKCSTTRISDEEHILCFRMFLFPPNLTVEEASTR